jgi:hypothetical protein
MHLLLFYVGTKENEITIDLTYSLDRANTACACAYCSASEIFRNELVCDSRILASPYRPDRLWGSVNIKSVSHVNSEFLNTQQRKKN